MLQNYDTDWRQVKIDHTAAYFKVPPGSYVFKLKAVSSEGVWAEKAITVLVLHPWWQTWWGYGFLIIMIAGGIWGFIAFRSRSLRRENKRLEQMVTNRTSELNQSLQHLQSTQAKLIQAENMASLGELTAGIAHEIQNPLNFMYNFSEVSQELVFELREEKRKAVQDPKLQEEILEDLEHNLSKIQQHGRRADAIVKNMLQHSRSNSGERELINLNSLTDEYLRLAYSGFRSKEKNFSCSLETSYDPIIEKVEAVPHDIGRVLLNLFNNAFYAVQQKQRLGHNGYEPKVIVSTRKTGEQVEIHVWDNGTGMPESVKNKIFQPFFTIKPTGQGTGLGLSLSYDIITKGHGGELKVESVEGFGTDFTIVLPHALVAAKLPAV